MTGPSITPPSSIPPAVAASSIIRVGDIDIDTEAEVAEAYSQSHSNTPSTPPSPAPDPTIAICVFNVRHFYPFVSTLQEAISTSLAAPHTHRYGYHVPSPTLRQSPEEEGEWMRKGVWALKGVSITMRLGECFGLLGPNGAGAPHSSLSLFPI
jgi:ABC-type glutathione transport system ATPase component